MAKWKCKLCGFEYDEDEGLPDRGIDAGTPFSEISDAFPQLQKLKFHSLLLLSVFYIRMCKLVILFPPSLSRN